MAEGDTTLGALDPFMTSDEALLLQELDPSHRLNSVKRMEKEDSLKKADYLQMHVKEGLEDIPGIVPTGPNAVNGLLDPREIDDVFSGRKDVSGGFAFTALIPLATAVAPSLINLAVKAIGGLIKLFKKKKKPVPPQVHALKQVAVARKAALAAAPPSKPVVTEKQAAAAADPEVQALAAEGEGAYAPNARGAYAPNLRTFGHGKIKKWIGANLADIIDDEDAVRQYRGRRFWKEMMKVVEKHTAAALQNFGMTQTGAEKMSNMALHRIFPGSFHKFIATAKDDDSRGASHAEPSGKGNESHLRSIVRPLCEWSISKAVKGKADRSRVRAMIDKELSHLDSRYAEGSGKEFRNFWPKVKKIMKRVANVVIPQLANVSKTALPVIVKQILGSIKVQEKDRPWLAIAEKAADSAAKMIPNLEGKKIFSEEPEGEGCSKPRKVVRKIVRKAPAKGRGTKKDKPYHITVLS